MSGAIVYSICDRNQRWYNRWAVQSLDISVRPITFQPHTEIMTTTKLSRIAVDGFKSLGAIDLELGPITVLIGANGSGKSNFVGIFSLLHAVSDGRLGEYVARSGGADTLLHFGPHVTETMRVETWFERDEHHENRYEISLGHALPNRLVPLGEVVYYRNVAHYAEPYNYALTSDGKEAGLSLRPARGIHSHVIRHLESCRVYHFEDTSDLSPLKKTAELHDNRYLRADGSNLAAFLYLLRERHESFYWQVVRTVKLAAPFFVDFDLEPDRLNPGRIRLQWRHEGSDAYWDVSSLSNGTLRFVALAALFLQPEEYRPTAIIIDEPELGLHPYAITLLASMIQQASVETQVIVSTQSSFLVDHFAPEDVLVADRIAGSTHFTRLSSENLENWLVRYSLGQLWEKNILGGRPRPERLQ